MTLEECRELIDLIVQAAASKAESLDGGRREHYEADRNAAADALAKLIKGAP